MNFEWLVALRYLRSPHRPAVLRLVTLLSVIGVAAGSRDARHRACNEHRISPGAARPLLGVTAHVNLKPVGTEGIRDYRGLIARLSSRSGRALDRPCHLQHCLAFFRRKRARHRLEGHRSGDRKTIGRSAAANRRPAKPNFARGRRWHSGTPRRRRSWSQEIKIARRRLRQPDESARQPHSVRMVPRSRRFRIAGIFDSGFYDYDANWGFVTLRFRAGPGRTSAT